MRDADQRLWCFRGALKDRVRVQAQVVMELAQAPVRPGVGRDQDLFRHRLIQDGQDLEQVREHRLAHGRRSLASA